MNIKLVITDIDGVWTDGGMYYDETGNEWKKFNTSDSAGVIFLQSLNIPLAIISGEKTRIVENRARKLKIDHVYLGVKNKLETAINLCKELNVSLNHVAFLGDDINDIPLLREAELAAVPSSSPEYVKKWANWTLEKRGGEGAFREFVERLLKENDLLEEALDLYSKKISDPKTVR